ncbi:MAG TPA: LapA family protein [Desulfatiglandales bacterium]|nr:LapA family protein [Desulfatiglandales bacterium]
MKHIKAMISILLMLLVIILIVENIGQLSQTLTLRMNFAFWGVETAPMAFYFVIIIVFLLGVLIASFYGILERFRLKSEIRRLSKENKEKDRELNSFRNLPIMESKAEEEDKELPEADQV